MELYYQTDEKGFPLYDFCATAVIGASFENVKSKPFYNLKGAGEIPTGNNVVVGSVEACGLTLKSWGIQIPLSVDKMLLEEDFNYSKARDYYGRDIEIVSEEKLREKISNSQKFIKPHGNIKGFNGFVCEKKHLPLFEFHTENYKGLYQMHDVVNFISEYRVYILHNNIHGICHYAGNPLIFFDSHKLLEIVSGDFIGKSTYVVDIGITLGMETFIVEYNDAWAIGNYGLSESKYWKFIKTGWINIIT